MPLDRCCLIAATSTDPRFLRDVAVTGNVAAASIFPAKIPPM